MAKGKIITKSLKQQAYEKLSTMYLKGDLKPGDPLLETELSEGLNISRTPLREAFLQLEKEGLVEIIPRKGAFVRRITLHDIQELFQIREAVEGMAAYLASTRLTEDQFNVLDRKFLAVSLQEDKLLKNQLAEEAGGMLHSIILIACDNQRIREILGSYRTLLTQERAVASSIPHQLDNAFAEHLLILENLKKGPEEAELSMRQHIRNTLKMVMENPGRD